MSKRRSMDILDTALLGSRPYMERHEYIMSDNPPQPRQLQELANISARSAADRGQLRSPERLKSHYCIDEVDLLNADNLSSDLGRIRHRMAVRIGKKAMNMSHEGVGEKVWTLKYFNRYFIEQASHNWISASVGYQFEWNRRHTLVARRKLRVIDESCPPVERLLEDEVEQFHLEPDMADMWHAKSQYEQVTSDDVEMQIAELSAYYESLANAERRTAA